MTNEIFIYRVLPFEFYNICCDIIWWKYFPTIIEKTGFRKAYVQSVDNKIDDLIYKSKQIELQIDKIRNFFSTDKIDETKYGREESRMLENAVYTPVLNMFILMYRISFGILSIMILCFAVIFQLIYKSLDLRKRVRRLEEAIYAGSNA